MIMIRLRLFLVSAAICLSAVFFGTCSVAQTAGKFVKDNAGVIDADTMEYLERRLASIKQTTPSPVRIRVVTFATMEDIGSEDLATVSRERLGEDERARRRDRSNGMTLLVAVKERRVAIGVSSNMRRVMDARLTSHIVNDIIAPYMSRGEYSLGIRKGVDELISIAETAKIPVGPSILMARLAIAAALLILAIWLFRFFKR